MHYISIISDKNSINSQLNRLYGFKNNRAFLKNLSICKFSDPSLKSQISHSDDYSRILDFSFLVFSIDFSPSFGFQKWLRLKIKSKIGRLFVNVWFRRSKQSVWDLVFNNLTVSGVLLNLELHIIKRNTLKKNNNKIFFSLYVIS